ncbi:hypothetical protein ANCCEY_10247 [Ancylostoma ceylanicum]|uniref:Uncharacterized protein n=1 Tax=Ancylostoma ceylanicum TaxID=53326 RepID=A0A0D6LFC4_9BILA|nr:hypothetical protein ANCCEY_10247 [Ancylostoma ceylanicum]
MLTIVYPRESDRACRDFRVKFPDEIIHDSLPGQLWFGAECLAAGSSIIDHESESDAIRPLAKELTRHLDSLRDLLKVLYAEFDYFLYFWECLIFKDQSLRDPLIYTDAIKESLLKFDHLFAAFEFQYVSAMVPVKSVKEHDAQLDVAVLFSDVLERALAQRLITQEQIDSFDPIVMICIPRLAIVWGLIYYPEGALNVDGPQENISEMFRPYYSLLSKIRNLLLALTPNELLKVGLKFCFSHFQHKCMNCFSSRDEFGRSKTLFVCISGVADQLQTNYSSEVRKVLKLILQPTEVIPVYEVDIFISLRSVVVIFFQDLL